MYTYEAVIIRVVDGDTVDAVLDLGFSLKYKARFRIKDFDAPETWRPKNDLEKKHGEEAALFATELLLNKQVIISTEPMVGIYGRYSASITLYNGDDFASIMVDNGFQKRSDYR